jgi:hypothetical protein
MKSQLCLIIVFLIFIHCSGPKPETNETDSTQIATDSISLPSDESDVNPESENTLTSENETEVIYEITTQPGFISDPFDFELNAETLKNLLGPQTQIMEQDFEGGEDYPAYTHITVTCADNELKFYSYSGKHFADINTSRLPLKKGIQIGISKASFLDKMELTGDDASYANTFKIYDSYGEMEFSFKADTLSHIYVSYEEGD